MQGVSLRRIPPGHPGARIAVARVHYSADPTMSGARLDTLREKYTSPARWRREMEIEYEALEGERYYPEFGFEQNACRAFDVSDPELWTIWHGGDPHGRTQDAHLWVAFNALGDRRICGELWPTEANKWPVKEMCDVIDLFEGDSMDKPAPFDWCRGKRLRIYQRVMDTYGIGANSDEGVDFFESYRKHKSNGRAIVFQKALKGEQRLGAARDAIGKLFQPVKVTIGDKSSMQAPCQVFEFCHETIREYENVRYPEGSAEKASEEKPMTYRKHLIDCHHYIETARPRFVAPRRGGSDYEPIYPNLGR